MKYRLTISSVSAAILLGSLGVSPKALATETQRSWIRAMACDMKGDRSCAISECNHVLADSLWIGKYCLAVVLLDEKEESRENLEQALDGFKRELGGRSINWTPKVAAADKLKGPERGKSLMDALGEQVKAEFGATEYAEASSKGRAALAELERLAQAGDPEAQYKLGEKYFDGDPPGIPKNDQLAVQWFSRAASMGHARAQYGMGSAYYFGRGVPKDAEQAAIWYRRAAEKGIADAQFNLARMLNSGEGVAKDERLATEWYRKAADAGNPRAQNSLGVQYEFGNGVAKDISVAIGWYRKAALQNEPHAQTNLGRMAETALGMPKDHAAAAKWYELAARQNHAPAQWRLGYLLENGWGVARDPARAIRLYQAAGAAGESAGWYNLGVIYYEGKIVPLDGARAVDYLMRAAESGHVEAMYLLGVLHGNGKLIAKDSAKAVGWYRKAAELGLPSAQNNLGVAYHNAAGVEANSASAVYWYAKAAQQGYALAVDNLKNILPQRAVSLVTSVGANLRSQPSMDAATLMTLPRGTRVYWLDDPAPGWKEVYVENSHLIGYVSSSLIAPAASNSPSSNLPAVADLWPARPAAKPGFVTCNTSCQNGDCRRTYSDGRKVRFQAKQVWNTFTNQFDWDSSGC